MPDQDPARKAEQPVSPTVREVAIVLFRQRRVFVGVSGLVLVLAVVYAFAGTTYRAHVRVLVRRGRADPPVTAQPNAPPDFSRVEVTEEELNSEVELLKDADVLRHVVEANDLASHDWLRWLRPNEEQAARVEQRERCGDVAQVVAGLAIRQRRCLPHVLPLEQFHRVVGADLIDAIVEDPDDARVIESG